MKFSWMGNLEKLEYPKRMLQTCPLCGEPQPMYIHGLCKNVEDNSIGEASPDLGYSFCNCNNIWFTKWENMDQSVYDDEYVDGYSSDLIKSLYGKYAKKYFPMFSKDGLASTFLEIGSINDSFLDIAKEYGFLTFGLDIQNSKQERKHAFYYGNFEDIVITQRFNVIWASHVFEHFKDPIRALRLCKQLLVDNGYLFIAMPDPFWILWNKPYSWSHWVVREHHIMWDMDSFIKVANDIGLKCVYSERNIDNGYVVTGDYHLVFKK